MDFAPPFAILTVLIVIMFAILCFFSRRQSKRRNKVYIHVNKVKENTTKKTYNSPIAIGSQVVLLPTCETTRKTWKHIYPGPFVIIDCYPIDAEWKSLKSGFHFILKNSLGQKFTFHDSYVITVKEAQLKGMRVFSWREELRNNHYELVCYDGYTEKEIGVLPHPTLTAGNTNGHETELNMAQIENADLMLIS